MRKNDIEYLAYAVLEKAPLSLESSSTPQKVATAAHSDPALSDFIGVQSLGQNEEEKLDGSLKTEELGQKQKGHTNVCEEEVGIIEMRLQFNKMNQSSLLKSIPTTSSTFFFFFPLLCSSFFSNSLNASLLLYALGQTLLAFVQQTSSDVFRRKGTKFLF